MANICIIPARGGSKRIPRKNIKNFLGKPIIAYSIEAAINSKLFDEVMVSTDDPEIAEITIKHGASVPFMRSKKKSDDFATLPEVIKEVIEKFQKSRDITFDNICCVLATNPFISDYLLKDSYQKFIDQNGSSLIAVTEHTPPIQRTFEIKNNLLSMVYPEYFNTRTQDLEIRYHDAGSFFWVKNDSFRVYKKGLTDKTIPYILSNEMVQDIDNLSDWKLAELKYKILLNG